MSKGINFGTPRQLPDQQARYYLPWGVHRVVTVYQSMDTGRMVVHIPAKKLLRELKEWERLESVPKGKRK